jgi:hypothetical protein
MDTDIKTGEDSELAAPEIDFDLWLTLLAE